MRLSTALAVGLGSLTAPSAFAITITSPSPSDFWVQSTSNVIRWTASANDPSPVAIFVQNPNITFLNGGYAIATNVDVHNESFTVTNVTLNVHPGYTVQIVNNTNPSQVFAQSQAFEVKAAGTAPAPGSNTSAPAASPTSTAPSGNSTSGNSTSSNSTSTSGGKSSTNTSNASPRVFDGPFGHILPMLGMTTAMAVLGAWIVF